MFALFATVAFAQEPPPQVVIHTEAPPAPVAPEMRSGPSVGLSAGVATGIGPTLGIPFGRSFTVQLTVLPILVPDEGGGGSGGVRFQQFLGKNPRARMYLVEGVGMHGWDESWLWGAGIGAGVEIRKDWSTGLTKWVDITVTAIGVDDTFLVLPLPQAGIAYVF